MDRAAIGDHARLTYRQVMEAGPPREPLEEDISPVIHPAARDELVRVRLAKGTTVQEKVFLVRTSVSNSNEDVFQAYRRIPSTQKETIRVQHGGEILFALVLPKIEDNLFEEPFPGNEEYVAIKQQPKAAVQDNIRNGCHENPYLNIHRMQQLGDNIHVLKCIEALEDDEYLYSVMPRCDAGLMDRISWSIPQTVENFAETHSLFWKILKNLHYLQSHGICHHDISPANLMMYNGNLVMIDLSMSLRVPTDDSQENVRYLMTPQGTFGTKLYIPLEVWLNRTPFDGFAVDLWASAVILYNMWTGYRLYLEPHPGDLLFRYFLLAGALSNTPLNERTIEILMATCQGGPEEDRHALMVRASAHLHVPHEVMQLMHHLLKVNPEERYTLAQAMESQWMGASE